MILRLDKQTCFGNACAYFAKFRSDIITLREVEPLIFHTFNRQSSTYISSSSASNESEAR